ncbi:MAG: D-arabinono-1,4-lactone oxidase [Pseudomonadota bacterium]
MSRRTRRLVLKTALATGMGVGAASLHSAQKAASAPASAASTTTPVGPPAAPVGGASATTANTTTWRNWSGIHSCQPNSWQVPATVDALAELLRHAPGPIRCVGAGHSFTALVPTTGTLLSLDRLSGITAHGDNQATLGAGTRLQVANRQLDAKGLALYNLPDIDAQTLAGAMATATHGTGVNFGALHTDLLSLKLMTPSGQLLHCSPSQQADVFAAAQVSLGAMGVLTEMTLRVRPSFHLQRRVWLAKTQDLLDQAPTLAERHRQFELYLLPFTGYGAAITHDEVPIGPVQRAAAADEDVLRDLRLLRDWLGRWPGLRRWAAQRAIDPDQTENMRDLSWKLLSSARPTRFNESEGHVPRESGIKCLREVLETLERRNEVFFPIEFRYIKADQAWLSPFHGRDSCSIAAHALQGEAHDYLVQELGPVFRRHGARPHWGKLHNFSPAELRVLYPEWKRFAELRRELDPQGRMLTPYMKQLLGET